MPKFTVVRHETNELTRVFEAPDIADAIRQASADDRQWEEWGEESLGTEIVAVYNDAGESLDWVQHMEDCAQPGDPYFRVDKD